MTIDDPAYRKLRKTAQHLAQGEPRALTTEEQADLLRLAHELEVASVQLEAQNEELHRAAREREISRQELFDLYESAPVAYVSLSAKGIVQQANALARQLLNTDGNSPIGRGFSSFVLPDDWGTYFRHMKSLSEDNACAFFDLRLDAPAHRPITVHIRTAAQFDRQGHLATWQLTFFDVTRQRRQDRQLKLLHEQLDMAAKAADLGTWNYDPASGKMIWNDRLYRLLGLQPGNGPEDGELFFGSIHPNDRRGILRDSKSFLESGKDDIEEDFRIRRTDGTIRWMAWRGRICRDADGRPTHISGVSYDISTRKTLENKKNRAQLQLAKQLRETRRLNEELSQYAYAVSHDLKEPMRAIRNYADFLIEDLADKVSGNQKQYLDRLKMAVAQGDALIDALLGFSRIGRAALENETLDLPDLVSEIRYILMPAADVEIHVDSTFPTVVADRILLKLILQNLIANAIKFNRSAPKRVAIGWQPAPGNRLDIHVRDNGIGIDPQYREKIFRIFQRLHNQRDYDGTGIGLAIVRKAAHLLGGTVQVASEPGKGSIFTVRLPKPSLENPSTRNSKP